MNLHRIVFGLLLLSCMAGICNQTNVGRAEEPSVQDGGVRGGLDQLYRAMETRARAAAETGLTTIELAERTEFNVESETETRLVGSATYHVHLRGNIIGRNRYLVIVRVRGELSRSGDSYSATVLGNSVLLKTRK